MTNTLKQLIDYSKANPTSDVASQLQQAITSGAYDQQAADEGVDLSWAGRPKLEKTPPPPSFLEKTGKTLKKVGGFIAKSEVELGKDIAAGATSFLPKSWTGQKSLEEANAMKEQVTNNLITKLQEVREKGGDTSKWLKLLEQQTGQSIPTMEDLYPALQKTNWQVAGDIIGTTADLLSAGSYGNVTPKGSLSAKLGEKFGLSTTKVGLPTSEKITTSLIKTGAEKTLGQTLKQIGVKTAVRSGVGGATGYGYDISQNLQQGKEGGDIFKPGMGFWTGLALPAAIGAFEAGRVITKAEAPRLINSLVKPKQADFAYGKNPGRAVSEMGITGNNLDDFANNIRESKNKVGEQIGAIYDNPLNANLAINGNDEIAKLDKAIQEAAKGGKNNQGIVTNLQNIKDSLLYEHQINAKGVIEKIGTQPRDLSALSPKEAFKLKEAVAEATQFTGRPSDDKKVNLVLKKIYGGLKEKLNTAVGKNNPEINNLNEKYADLISAEIATVNRDKIVERANIISMPIKLGTAAGVITAIASGGATIPAILTGVGFGVLDKALGSTAVKSRIAAWLGSESPSVITKVLQQNPAIKNVLYRAFPKFASQLGFKE